MRTEPRELLAVGIFGSKSRIGDRIELLLRRGRTFSSRASVASVIASAGILTCLLLGGSLAPRWIAFAQRQTSQRFEVASIRACRDGRGRSDTKMGSAGGSPNVSPGRLNTECAALAAAYPMAGLIQRAYGGLGLGRPALGSALPISGGPAWIYSDRYTINAKAADQANEKTIEGPMLQALLEDRFKLKVHRETRQVPVYALSVAKGGPRLQAADTSCIPLSTYPRPPLAPGKKFCLDVVGGRNGPNTTLKADASTIEYVCKLLGLVLDRPVIDKTAISGKYRVYLEFAVDQATPGALEFPTPPSDDAPAASIFTVVQQQLGLKLEPSKGPREFLVIDHIERPSEN
jgi:uncharacterized protein (TIGR03435 family)